MWLDKQEHLCFCMLKLEPFLDGKIVSNRLFLQKERKQTSRDKEVKLTFFGYKVQLHVQYKMFNKVVPKPVIFDGYGEDFSLL